MAIKEELKQDIKKDGGGKDEIDALDALEKEAKEYDKVRPIIQQYPHTLKLNTGSLGCRDRPHNTSFQTGCVGLCV